MHRLYYVIFVMHIHKCVLSRGECAAELSMSGCSELSLGELPMESWMSHLPCALWDTPLYHLAIPGRYIQEIYINSLPLQC